MCAEDLAVIDIEDVGDASFEDGFLQGAFQMRKFFVPVELGMRDKSGEVIECCHQVCSFFVIRPLWIGQIRAVHDIGLPDLVGMLGLEQVKGFLFFFELLRGEVVLPQQTGQGAGFDESWLGQVMCFHDLDDFSGASARFFFFQIKGFVQDFGWDFV